MMWEALEAELDAAQAAEGEKLNARLEHTTLPVPVFHSAAALPECKWHTS